MNAVIQHLEDLRLDTRMLILCTDGEIKKLAQDMLKTVDAALEGLKDIRDKKS